jgi:AcrR family transcriptional regulator
MTAPIKDRRVRKTRRQLRDTLVSLILERGWDQVSVMDVCAQADIGRSTFYLHFADKEDLLLSGFDELHQALQSVHVKAAGAFAFVLPLFEHAKENTRLMRAVAGRKSGQAVQRRFRDVANQLIDGELGALGIATDLRQHAARYLSGALVELLLGWLETPRGMDAPALARIFVLLTEGAIKAARAGAR